MHNASNRIERIKSLVEKWDELLISVGAVYVRRIKKGLRCRLDGGRGEYPA